MSIILTALAVIVFSYIFIENKKENPQKIFGVYSQPGKWYHLKYLLFLTILTVRKAKTHLKRILRKSGGAGLGERVYSNVEDMEKLQQLSRHEKAFDAVFFHAANSKGYYICGGLERRHKGKVNGLLYIVDPELGLLSNLRLPKTLMDADTDSLQNRKTYAAEGICFTPVEPMKLWRLSFNGKMKVNEDPNKIVEIKLEADWYSDFPYFLFDTDMSSRCLARAVAREMWSKEYFQALKDAHQSHYEQMGFLKGSLSIDKQKVDLDMQSFRDHSFGHKRDWLLMHRYIYHTVFLEDGTRISVGVVSQPCTTSSLEMGYVVGKAKKIYPIEHCDLELYQHGENGNPPKEISFTVTTRKGIYQIQATTEYQAIHYKGNDVEARMVERFMSYVVNGIRGKGISEWHYNNVQNK